MKIATEKDWKTEYLSSSISVKSVNGVVEAIDHINKYGSSHTDCVVTKNKKTAKKFLYDDIVDCGDDIVYYNGSSDCIQSADDYKEYYFLKYGRHQESYDEDDE